MPTIDAVLAGFGVNTHVDAVQTGYGNVPLVASALSYLGVSLIRDHAYDIDLPAYQALAQSGVRVDLIVDGDVTASVAALAPLGAAIAAFEGANEVDLQPVAVPGVSDPVAAALAEQQLLYATVRSTPALAAIPIINQSVGDPSNDATYAATLAYADLANAHLYAAYGDVPGPTIANGLQGLHDPTGQPKTITETGYYTLPNNTIDPSGVDESVQARLTLDTLFDAARAGVASTFLYELLDEAPDPLGLDPELHYGLFHADGSPKPAATAIHDLTTILHGADQALPAATGIAPTVAGLGAPLNSMVMTGVSGATTIAVWDEPPVWNPDTQQELAVTPQPVTVGFGATVASVAVFDPLLGTAATATYHDVSSIAVTVTDHPVLVELYGASPTPATTPASTPTPTPALISTPGSAGPATRIGVYRFFDTTFGTHFYTSDPAEAQTVRQTRPDLVPEGSGGIGLEAVASGSGDTAAVPVYRFFDTQHGTHFFTASAGERDGVIASRADLVYEPGSVFYEHAQAQTGDTPVYRFFDTRYGTHFYTDSANERAAIIDARPDLIAEGIGFYEPHAA